MAKANIGGQQFNWCSFQFLLYGQKPGGFLGLDIKTDRTMKPVYGVSDEMYGWIKGRKAYSASITVTMDVFQAMVDISPERDITNQEPVDLIATMGLTATSPKKTIILRDAVPMSHSIKTESKSDEATEVEIQLFVTSIQFV